nr:MAG TPA: hypothetical protein [Caudoviricetes sp.]
MKLLTIQFVPAAVCLKCRGRPAKVYRYHLAHQLLILKY